MPVPLSQRVFLSYARKDGREAALHLKSELERERFTVWLDTERIEGAASWTREIEQAINQCDVLLGLLTAGSYESEICRAEQMRALRLNKCVIPVLVQPQAERPLYFETKNWRAYPTQLPALLADIHARRAATLKEEYRQTRVRYITAPVQPVHYLDRPEAIRALRETVVAEDGERAIALTALEGMGGIGKTVLALALCRDAVVQAAFPDGIVWVTVGREREHPYIQQMREIAKALGDDLSRYENDLAAEHQYRTILHGKAGLIVLDDIWSKADLDPFLAESPRSRFLFTTRDASIARFSGAREHRADLLDEAQARQLLADWTGVELRQLPSTTAEIVRECGRLPLALATMGALLREAGPEEWQDWLERLKRADLSAIESALPEGQTSFFRAVSVSVEALKPIMRDRYAALAVLLEDVETPLPILETLWRVDAEAARLTGRHLAARSLAEWSATASALRLHDLQLDYVRARYPDQEALSLLVEAVRLSAHAIGEDPGQFASQMVGRLLSYQDMPGIAGFLHGVAEGTRTPWLRPLLASLHPPGTSLVRTLEGHSNLIYAVAVSRDGCLAVSTCWDGTLKVWDLASGRALRTWEGDSWMVNSVALSGNGRLAVSTSSDYTLKVWDVTTGCALRTLKGHSRDVNGVAVSGDGQLAVSASSDHTLKVWDVASGRALRTLEGHSDSVTDVAVSGDGRIAVSVSNKSLKVWDVASGCVLRTLEGHSDSVTAVALSGDGRLAVSASSDKSLKVWDVASGRALRTLEGHSDSVTGVAVSGDGRLAVSASSDKSLKVWDVASGRAVRTLEGHSYGVNDVALSEDGRLAVSASSDKSLKVWDVTTGRTLRTREGHSRYVDGVAVSGDGRLAVSASSDHTLKVWDVASGRVLRTFEGHSDSVTDVAVSGDGRLAVSASSDQSLKVWDLASGRALRTLEGCSGPARRLAMSEDGRLAVSVSKDHTLTVWDVEGGRALRTLEGHSRYVSDVSLSGNGRLAVSASHDGLKVWDVESGRMLRILGDRPFDVFDSVAVTGDGRLAVSASNDGMLNVWDVENGRVLRALEGPSRCVNALAVSGDGRLVVSASSDKLLKVWDVESGVLLATFACDAPASCCVFSGEHQIIAGDAVGRLHFLWLEQETAPDARRAVK